MRVIPLYDWGRVVEDTKWAEHKMYFLRIQKTRADSYSSSSPLATFILSAMCRGETFK